jgi:serine phosphatase RsbU (regulator of sigma subunit)
MNDELKNSSKPKHAPVVMIVDDEEMVTNSLASFLQLETDYSVLTFQSPLEALQTLHQKPVDLVISDFLMPDMDGLRFLSEVKKMYPEVTRILLTGYADKENAINAINEVGLFQYVEKPWDNDSLKLIIRNGVVNKSLRAILQEKIQEFDKLLLERDRLAQRNELLREELSLAKKVQESMLPQGFPELNGISFVAKYLPALEIGGDFYDIIPLANNHVAVLLADITGHGIQAALSTTLLKSAFSSFVNMEANPGDILKSMNTILFKGLPKNIFVAALVITIDLNTGQCKIANGGVPHPFHIRRKDRHVERIPANGLFLGIVSEEVFQPGEERTVSLNQNDCLILYTDGLSEAENTENKHFDTELLMTTLLENCMKSGGKILENLKVAAQKFSKPDHLWDDITMLAIEINSK